MTRKSFQREKERKKETPPGKKERGRAALDVKVKKRKSGPQVLKARRQAKQARSGRTKSGQARNGGGGETSRAEQSSRSHSRSNNG
jgi:hypothetical protein